MLLVSGLWHISKLDSLSPNGLANTPVADEYKPARLDLDRDVPEEPGMSHSGSLVNPDDSFVGLHNAPAPPPVVGVIGQGKAHSPAATEQPEQVLQGFQSLTVNPSAAQSPETDPVARALDLLASACVRVLTLGEQRVRLVVTIIFSRK